MFSTQQVLEEVKAVQDGKISAAESAVVTRWLELAEDNWFDGDDDCEVTEPMQFNERTPKQVVLDFNVDGLLNPPLSNEEIVRLLDEISQEKEAQNED